MTNNNITSNKSTLTQTYFGNQLYDINVVSELIRENNNIDWNNLK